MLLTLAIFLPLLGAVLVLCLPREKVGLIRWTSVGCAVATFVPIVLLTVGYAKGDGAAVAERMEERIAEVLEGSPLRADIEALLEDPRNHAPALLEFAPADPGNPTATEQERLAAQARLLRIEAAGAYAQWHEAWELTVAMDTALARHLRYVAYVPWIGAFNIHYFVGVDGLSVPLIFLTGLLGILCFVYSFNITKGVKAYYALFLLLQAGLTGVFAALDFFLFYVFWEIVLLPMYFLIGYWGGPNRIYAAIKFFIYTLVGSVLMLVAMLALYWYGGHDSFNLLTLIGMGHSFAESFQMWIFAALFVAFAIKVPVFPFHTWLPDAHVEAPTAVSVILAGVLLKMGGYGFFRFSYTLASEVGRAEFYVMLIGILGLINIIYGAFCAMAQTDFKSLVAYSSISHMGFVLVGMAAMTTAGVTGAALQMVTHGVSSAMMFLIVGILYDRAHHRDLNDFGGIGVQMPYYTGFAIIGFFTALGLPGLAGFISEFLVFKGGIHAEVEFPHVVGATVFGLPLWIVLCCFPGMILTAGYVLWTVQRVYLGEPKREEYRRFPDLSLRETFVLAPLAILCIVLGVWPRLILDLMDPTLDTLRRFVIGALGS